MKPISEIRALFNVIKTETRRWFNTGARIDEVGQEILDHIEYLEGQGGDSLWETGEGNIVVPAENRKYTSKSMNEVDVVNGSVDKFLNERGDFTTINTGATSHPDLTNKNAETTFQHIDTTTTKETLVEGAVGVMQRKNMTDGNAKEE